jgi:hypothetical protein
MNKRIIAAVRSNEELVEAANSDVWMIFMLAPNIEDIKRAVNLEVAELASLQKEAKRFLDNRKDLKNVSSIFFPQIYAFANNLEINDMDLYFRAEDQTAMFLQPLKLVRVEG